MPVATATSAAIATTSLVSFRKKDTLSKEEDLDKSIDDLKLPDEKYQDVKLFYSEDGTGKNHKVLDPETAEKLAQLLKERGSLDSLDKSNKDVKLPENLDAVGVPDPVVKSPTNLDLEKSTEKRPQQIPNDVGSGYEQGSAELQKPANLSDSVDQLKGNVDDVIKGQNTENESTEPASVGGEQKGVEPTLSEKLSQPEGLGSQDQQQDLSSGDEENRTKVASSSLSSADSGDNLDQNEAKPGLETDSTNDIGTPNNSELGAQVRQQEQNEVNDGSGKNGESEGAPKGPDFNGDGRSSNGDNSLNEGTDSSGNRQNLTDEDIKRWSSVEAEISSVVDELQALINI
ncbi:hypothetical protein A6V39_05095 [Candidatus Mycoplasma haematobovis]|uniref:Uncharacterized protein n=1 Tax=Candidatus Mycoplasma haematobovis TaxID=432608 RepID=A0A1A9QCI6_9MOLU|nr:hypothetical protein [Candidatus Mycoplasma haematobovis]OAL09804.1 hypothetical protein A6V39_05095 [Candidatus Mycoplasma haematobovis]